MRRRSVRIISATMAVAVVGVASLAFFVNSPLYGYFERRIPCMCIETQPHPIDSDKLAAANGWFRFGTSRFNLYAPPTTIVRQRNAWDGEIVTPRFTLAYEFGASGFAAAGRDAVDEPLRIEGRNAQLRRANVNGPRPFFAGLFMPQALVRGGQPVSLLIQGTFQTRGERAVADAMLATVSLRPFAPPEWERLPPEVKAEPPVIATD